MTKERQTANSTCAKGRFSCFADSFVGIESAALRINVSGNLPLLLVATSHEQQCFGDTANLNWDY
jgi:hypothetical protein